MWRTYLWRTKFLITILNEFYDLFISYFVDAEDFEPEVPVKTTDQWEGEDEDDVKVYTIFFLHVSNYMVFFILCLEDN